MKRVTSPPERASLPAAQLTLDLAAGRFAGTLAAGPQAAERALEGLTPSQREAVTHLDGPLLIVAGAGTGKTTVIARRIAWLIATRRAKPSEILSLTFTEKAAAEMEARVDQLVPYGYTDTWISTFHAFGDRVLREQALEIGIAPDFRVLSRPEQFIFFRDRLFEMPLERYRPLGDPTRYIRALLTLISRAKDEDIAPEAYEAFALGLQASAAANPFQTEDSDQAASHLELARTFQAVQRLMGEGGLVDFGDLIVLALQLFRSRPEILRRYQERFRYVLVDEFQDTNHAQFELVKLLAATHRCVTVVGDDDQSIYKFRGAAISNILGFTDAYPDARQVVLTENFRSTQSILDTAHRLIQHNNPDRLEVRNRLDKRLVSQSGLGAAVQHLSFDALSTEADAVAGAIGDHVTNGGRYGDCAILVRSNNDADPFLRALNVRGIPWWFSGTRGLYDREEVRVALAFLRVLASPTDNLSLYYLGTSPLYLIDATDMARALSYANRRNRSLDHVFRHLGGAKDLTDELAPESQATIARLIEDLDEMRGFMRHHATGRVLYEYLVARTGYIRRLATSEQPGDESRVASLARLFDIVSRHADVALYDRVPEFVRRMDDLIAAGDDPPIPDADPDFDGVQVLTVHKAKGLEFPVVFLVSCVADRFPTRARSDPLELPDELVRDREVLPTGDFHLQEERRLFYVGMTRAKHTLVLSSARDYGGVRPRKISRFVLEALDVATVDEAAFRASPVEAIHRHAPPAEAQQSLPGIMPPDVPITVSFRQIDDYQICPLKYKYTHVLRVPLLRDHRVVYGAAVHAGAMEYNRRRARGQPVQPADLIRALERAWVTDGFISREHEDQRLDEGRAVLRRFFEYQQASGAIPTMVENRFAIQVGTTLVRGRWDRVDIRRGTSEGPSPDASGGDEVVIIDFKTSDVRAQKDADRRAKDSLQLGIYALAYARHYGRIPNRLELHFLGPQQVLVGATRPSEAMLSEASEAIERAAAGIRAQQFTATPDYYRACRYCAFASICPYTATED